MLVLKPCLFSFSKLKPKVVDVRVKRNMANEDFSNSSAKVPSTSNGLREVLESLRTIFVATIALVISVADWISKRFTTWQNKAEEQAKTLEKVKAEEQRDLEPSIALALRH